MDLLYSASAAAACLRNALRVSSSSGTNMETRGMFLADNSTRPLSSLADIGVAAGDNYSKGIFIMMNGTRDNVEDIKTLKEARKQVNLLLANADHSMDYDVRTHVLHAGMHYTLKIEKKKNVSTELELVRVV